MEKVGKAITVTGRVQGVGFRWMTQLVAQQLHIFGKVENNSDGSVYIEAVGTPENMAKFTAAVKASPTPSGKVTHYEEQLLDPVPLYDRFRVTG
ncbi:acylphosphatase [Lacticaseibacillus suibinensis]|uniref:acylphosphatase n=1 Tax=Lacticaseibacillus suibinensis TaxID=2486011 RepID=UPI0019436E52|nr:acylphosphatase [Lacticaseibacillus suibinensis]